MAVEELREYRPALAEPADLDAFWRATIDEARAAATEPVLAPADTPVSELEVFDLTFSGFAGEPVKGWVIRPRGATEPRPVVVQYIGYGGGRGHAHENLAWAASGYVHLIMDTRGQGSQWTLGETADPHGSGPAIPGYMTRGIHDPHEYYYRRVYADAVRAVDTALALDGIDPERVAVLGGSQGGGIAIAAAALHPQVAAVMPDVPFLCDFPRSVAETPFGPFTELRQYLASHRDEAARVFETLSYVDGALLARRVSAPALFSVGLKDEVVLPSSIFAAYNALGSADRTIEVYPFNGHDGGGAHQWRRQVEWLGERFAR
jgi:cephalosporin-C deacetylase